MFLFTGQHKDKNNESQNPVSRSITKHKSNNVTNNLLTYKNITGSNHNNIISNNNLNITHITQYAHKKQQQNPYQLQQKVQSNRELLLMYLKLLQVKQSVWTRFFQFEKSQYFRSFDKKMQFKKIVRLRLDDIIYLVMLATILVTFAILPTSFISTPTNQTILTQLVSAYRYLLTFLFIFSILWLISTNGIRHWVFLFICLIFPLITFLIYKGIIPFGEIDTSTAIYSYLNILSLWGVYAGLYVVYPIKQFVRNKIGSLYSYLYALSTLTLFLVWPAYSLIYEFSTNMQITYYFITNNRALIIAFLCIIVFTFHLLTHSTFFQGKLEQTKKLLKLVFKQAQLTKALQEIEVQEKQEGEDSTLHPINRQTNQYLNKNNSGAINSKSQKHKSNFQSFLYRNFTIYSRIMSLVVFAFTIAIEIYVFLYLISNLTHIIRCIAVMAFYIGFLVYGCIINTVPISREATLYLFTVASIVPAGFSSLYCSNCDNSSFTFYEYIFLASSLPYATIFWCVVRSLTKRKPFLRTNMLVIMYIFIHIPLSLFMLNSLQMISSNAQTVIIFNYVVLGIVGLATLAGLISFIIWLCVSVKQLPKQEKQIDKAVDYNYHQDGNPAYEPYKKKQSFSLTYLALLDIRNLAELIDCIAFIACQLVTMYVFNYMNTTSQLSTASPNAKPIIYSQFYISFAYFTYSFCYIAFGYKNQLNIIILVALAMLGLFSIIFSYLSTIAIAYSFRVAGSASLAIFIAGIGLHIVKVRNKDIINFLSGVLAILLWVFLIIPYAIALPIVSAFIDITSYGNFLYGCILATTLLLIILVSAMSIVFNVLMNKFEQEKKAKFMLEDVQTYLRQEGIETEDQVLHIMYESFEYRDQKYVYFMKRGYPIRLYKDPEDPESNIKTIVYNYDALQQWDPQESNQQQKQKDYCWACLTCLCGYDQDELDNKVAQISQKNIVDADQMQQLVPEQFFKHIFVRAIRKQTIQKKYMDLTKLYSSKSIVLRHLTHTDRHTGQQFALLKSKKDRRLGVQLWHAIFNFLANEDDPPAKIIFNDFLIFCSLINIPQTQKNALNSMFLDYATAVWKNSAAIDINDFSLIVEHLTHQNFASTEPHEDYKFTFLIQSVYPRLCQYAEFQDVLNQTKIKKTKLSNSKNAHNVAPGIVFSQNQSGIRHGQVISKDNKGKSSLNMYSSSQQELNQSPFMTSFQKYKQITQKIAQRKLKYQQKKAQNWQQKLIQPAQQQKILPKVAKQEPKVKQKSCKKSIYQKYQACKTCCKKVQQEEQVILKRKHTKPWEYLAVESIRILQHKQGEWKQQNNQKNYSFRLILNNFLIAVFKLADLYTYLEITIMNPVTGWQSMRSFSVLLIQYKIQLYISFAVVLICAGLGIKGIQYIFQDRLGLTQTRIPAVFPHPMFFFTFIYKLLILSLFNTIIMTLLSTFMCDWTTSNTTTYYMILSSANPQIQCFSSQHNIYIICSLIAIILYYPLSAYTMPNFQFAEKRLDLKYKPSFLIIYFQVNFILAAGKVLLSQAVTGSSLTSSSQTVQILFQSINIFCIGLLALCVIIMRPCLIIWFNVVEFLIIWIGLVWNVFGLVLYLTGLWIVCIIASAAISIASIALAILFIRRKYFGDARIQAQANDDEIGELELGWKYKKQYNLQMVKYGGKQQANKDQFDEKYTLQNDNKYQINVNIMQNKDKPNSKRKQNRPSINNFTNDDVATNIGSHKKIETLNIQNLLIQ